MRDLFSSGSSVGPEYYDEWRDEEGKVVVSLVNTIYGQGLIRYPVRGVNCRHPEVFDFKKYLEMVSDLKPGNDAELTCPFCSVASPSFLFDRFIYNCIQNFPDYAQTPIESIQIERNGEFAWVQPEEEKPDSMEPESPFEEMESEEEPVAD